jgi:hypothetical protein
MRLDWGGCGREEDLNGKSAFTHQLLCIKEIRKLRTFSTRSVQSYSVCSLLSVLPCDLSRKWKSFPSTAGGRKSQ